MAARTFHPSDVLVACRWLRPRPRITSRHLLLTLAGSAVLSIIVYSYLRPDRVFLFSKTLLSWPSETPKIWTKRTAHVKEAFRHAYRGYEQHAFPHDELLPMSNGSIDNFNGWGVTAVDSLDTMLLMGFEDEYTRALPMISHSNFSLPTNKRVPFFETVIRYLGGLLGAYAMSGHDLLREKADELGSILAPAFNTTSGFPGFAVDTYTKKYLPFSSGVLAEIASCQMEYAYLGKITAKKEHVDHATLITSLLYNANLSRSGGMYPTYWNLNSGGPSGRIPRVSVGSLADSGHEYTLKQFLLTARTDKHNLEMYIRFTTYVINNLLFLTPNRHLLYVTHVALSEDLFHPYHSFEHLSCFFPGLLALGVHLLPLDSLDIFGIDVAALADDLFPEDRRAYADLFKFNLTDLHLWAAEGIAQTCYLTYADQPSGLGPEIVKMDVDPRLGEIRWIDAVLSWKEDEEDRFGWWAGPGSEYLPPGARDVQPWTRPPSKNQSDGASTMWQMQGEDPGSKRDYSIQDARYLLRPETVESLYILWRTTGDVKWRHRGWHIFQAIERHTKTRSGYTSVKDVDTARPTGLDEMPSYFLAETLKYLYLLFLDEDPLPLDKWVYNTEAHALPVFQWTREEWESYGIA